MTTWAFPDVKEQTISMVVRLHYANGKKEGHSLINGVHICMFATAANRTFPDLQGSTLAMHLPESHGLARHIRYLAIRPADKETAITAVEFVKGEDNTAPVVVSVTVE